MNRTETRAVKIHLQGTRRKLNMWRAYFQKHPLPADPKRKAQRIVSEAAFLAGFEARIANLEKLLN